MSEEDIIQSKKITTTQGIQGSKAKNLPLEGSPDGKTPVADTLPPPVRWKRRSDELSSVDYCPSPADGCIQPTGRNPKKKHKGPDFLPAQSNDTRTPGFEGDQISLKGIQNSVVKNLPHEGSTEVIGEEASGLPPCVCTKRIKFGRVPSYNSRGNISQAADPGIFPTPSNNIWILKPAGDQMSVKGEEKIAKEKAICMHCFTQLAEGEELLKSVCGCSNPLVHVTCADRGTRKEGNICNNCEKEVHNVAVTLHKVTNTIQGVKKAKKNKNCCFGLCWMK